MLRPPCDDCRREGRCPLAPAVYRETLFSIADDRQVECEELLLTWQAMLAA